MAEHPLAARLGDHEVTFAIDGPGQIAGVGNGNPQSLAPFQANRCKLFFGKAMLIVRSTAGQSGQIRIEAKAEGLNSGETVLYCQ